MTERRFGQRQETRFRVAKQFTDLGIARHGPFVPQHQWTNLEDMDPIGAIDCELDIERVIVRDVFNLLNNSEKFVQLLWNIFRRVAPSTMDYKGALIARFAHSSLPFAS